MVEHDGGGSTVNKLTNKSCDFTPWFNCWFSGSQRSTRSYSCAYNGDIYNGKVILGTIRIVIDTM